MFDYSNISPRDFEYIAKEYLELMFQGSSWSITKPTGDGNRDIELSYKFLDQEFEYWAEAKFTKSSTAHKLQKGQLDPTLLSAMLYDKPVAIKFISNNLAPENYYYRLTDFHLKTNIGVTMVLKDEFEQWLEQNPDVCMRYGIISNGSRNETTSTPRGKITIIGALITNEIDLNGYTLERKLVKGNIYFLYLLIHAAEQTDKASLRFKVPGFRFLADSTVLSDPESFSLRQGTYGYKFRFLTEEQFSGELRISLWQDDELVHEASIPDVSVLPSTECEIAYAQQSKIEAKICELAKAAGRKNKIAIISGKGTSGKSYLVQNLYRDLSSRYETIYLNFSDNELQNCKQLYFLLLFLNIGDIRNCSTSAIKVAVAQYASADKGRFLSELLEREETPQKCIDFLQMKRRQNILQMIFPQHSTMQKVVILEDIHKLAPFAQVSELFHQLLREFGVAENNQFIIATSRGDCAVPVDYQETLDGLTRDDKLVTLRHYFSQMPKELNFHRLTDSLLVFSNILRGLVEVAGKEKQDSLRFAAQIKYRFEHVADGPVEEYQTYLKEYLSYNGLLELVFTVGSGIPYLSLSDLYSAADIDFLIERKVFKLVGSKVYPFHDYYVASYMEGREMSPRTADDLEALAEGDRDASYVYLALLLKQGNARFFSKISKAREMRDRYFSLSRLYESYLLAQAIVDHIDFNEPLDTEEVYDVYILANSSFYTKDCDEIIALYNTVLEEGQRYQLEPRIWGALLRTRTELMNQYYWDLKLEELGTELRISEERFPAGRLQDHEIIRFACVHRLNRKMVFDLLMGRYEAAEVDYGDCVRESLRLAHPACHGFAEMDYGKGLYLSDAGAALKHMEKALGIFEEIGTEHRRRLDCECEVAFLHCLLDGAGPENLHTLESAALALRHSHYEEIFAKAKLKLAALYLCVPLPELQIAESEIIEAEYALSYRPCKRLEMLFANVKYALYMLKGEMAEAQNAFNTHQMIAQNLGPDYRAVPDRNMRLRFPRTAAFFRKDGPEGTDIVWIDPRIW